MSDDASNPVNGIQNEKILPALAQSDVERAVKGSAWDVPDVRSDNAIADIASDRPDNFTQDFSQDFNQAAQSIVDDMKSRTQNSDYMQQTIQHYLNEQQIGFKIPEQWREWLPQLIQGVVGKILGDLIK